MDERTRRICRNEALFRSVYEQIGEINESFGEITDEFAVICECGDTGCIEQLAVSRAAYHAVREQPTQFIVTPGHVEEDVEDVVARREGYWVVQKKAGEPAELAAELHRRT